MSRRRKKFCPKIFAANSAFLTTLITLLHELKPAQGARSLYNKTQLFLPIRVGIENFFTRRRVGREFFSSRIE